jgi:hypothetical protein
LTNVTTRVGTAESNISFLLTSVNGIRAEATLSLNVNGYITGWSLINNGDSGSFVVVASEFGFVDPGGGSPTFPISYSGGQLRMLNVLIDTLAVNSVTAGSIQYAAVGTGAIQSNAVTVPSIASASWTMSGGFYTNVLFSAC